jgi:endo-1,4-beta-D-glucanase Y
MLLASYNEGWTVFYLAANLNIIEVFKGILNWAKENLTTEVKNCY